MSQSAEFLQRKIRMAGELKSVVRNLKTIAATRIGPYENAVRSLQDYYRTVELGLVACMLKVSPENASREAARAPEASVGVVVFGSDQGLVGRYNDHLAEAVLKLTDETRIDILWPVGERLYIRLMESVPATDGETGRGGDGEKVHTAIAGAFSDTFSIEPPDHMPDTIEGITPLISRVLSRISQQQEAGRLDTVLFVHNRPLPGRRYEPVCQRLMPLDNVWLRDIKAKKWPTKLHPQVRRVEKETFAALIREYLFVSAFRACAESMASENAARLASMQGAEDNINRMLEGLQTEYNQTRQNTIDSELFEVVSGFEAMQSDGR